MTDRVIGLDKNWRFRAVDPREHADFAAKRLPERMAAEGWDLALVPGAVHLDLMRTGKIPDPFRGTNERLAYWVESQDFIYKTNFLLPDDWIRGLGREGQRIELNFESLETFATVWLNGQLLGESSNQFLPATFDATRLLRPGENVILIHFDSAVKRCTELELQHGRLEGLNDRTRVYARRAPYLTGWEMSPRLSGCGIWGKVTLRRVDRARLHNLSVPTRGLSTSMARVNVEIDIESLAQQDVEVEMQVERLDPIGAGSNYDSQVIWEKRKPLNLKAGRYRYSEEARLFEPALWWPLGFGNGRRTLYRGRVAVRMDGQVLDSTEAVFGLRRVELISREAEGQGTFYFNINGQPIFVRGASWVPPSMFPATVPDSEIRHLLDLAAAANINLLRVWGGGLYESDYFYRRCDELGIMVWQDFVFAQGDYPEFKEYWKSCQEESKHQVRRLRNHPSLVLWCGNDGIAMLHHEMGKEESKSAGAKIFSRLLPHVLKEYDGTRPYWPSTPFGGDNPNDQSEGDYREVDVWGHWGSVDQYKSVRARFVSSFGFQSLPNKDTIERFTDQFDKSLTHADFEAHQKQPDGTARLTRYMQVRFRPPQDFDEMIFMSQWTQADALSFAIDSWRANKPETMGAMIWHFNDCWPGITSSIIDANGSPKLAYWAVRQAFQSTSLILLPAEDGFRAVCVHDGPVWKGDQNLLCRLTAYGLDGQQLGVIDKEIVLTANQKTEIGLFTLDSLNIKSSAQAVVVGVLWSGRKVAASRLFAPAPPKKMNYPEPKIECILDCIVASRRAVFMLTSPHIVRNVDLRCEGLDESAIRFNNNVDLWPGREAWIHVDIPPDMNREALKKNMRFRCMNDLTGGRQLEWRELEVREPEESSTRPPSSGVVPLPQVSSDEVSPLDK